MLRKVRLYGQLAEFVGRKVIEADLSSAAEAVRMLIANFSGLDGHMADRHYKVLVGDGALTLDDLHNPVGQEEIKIVPVVVGAGGNRGGGLLSVVLGAALIAGAVVSGGASLGLSGFASNAVIGVSSTSFITTGAVAAVAGNIGIGLMLTGVAQMLSPVPRPPGGAAETPTELESNSFSGIVNTTRQGVAVPIAYGRVFVGSAVISAGLDVDQV